MITLPTLIHETRVFLADADLMPAMRDGSGDGWGGLIALVLLVLAILFAMYIAAREEWQFAQGAESKGGE
jgi:uncharacterized membrane protein (DUF4010 family)